MPYYRSPDNGIFSFTLDDTEVVEELKKSRKRSPKLFTSAVEHAASKFMGWTTEGSPRDPVKAPFDEGDLRHKVYVKVGAKKIKYKIKNVSG